MAKAKNKTVPTRFTAEEYLANIEDEARRNDCQKILDMMQEISGDAPKIWGTSLKSGIVGFGSYHYKYESGREGDALRLGFSSRAANISIYIMPDGRIFQLVDEEKRAWHAGVSEWEGETNINSNSIGIEIVNGGHDHPNEDGSLPNFPDVQINAVIALSKDIMKRHGDLTLLGHSDIAPARKIDPGENFPKLTGWWIFRQWKL